MKNLRIRKATSDDVEVILSLLYELGRPQPKNDKVVSEFKKLVKKYLKEKDKLIIIAQQGAQIVGLATIVFLPRLNHKDSEMYIPELVVRKKFQGKGIGKKIMESCTKLAKEKNCYRIRLESGNQRKESHIFYEKLGFVQSSLSFEKKI